MKKILLFLVLIVNLKFFAQPIVSKHGEHYLPEAKDWGISLDATKFIKNGKFEFVNGAQTIIGKYFLDSCTAIRAGIRIGINSITSKSYVIDRGKVISTATAAAYPASYPLKENAWKRTITAVGFSTGFEKRRGKTKLQGIYGAEVGVYFEMIKDKFTYGNKLNPAASTPVIVDSTGDAMTNAKFGRANNIYDSPVIQGVTGSARVIERNSGLMFSVVTRAFIGAEYFIVPKLSIGGEFGWGPSFTISGRSKTIYESIGVSTVPGTSSVPAVKQTTFDGPQIKTFTLDNDNAHYLGGLAASLRLNLYF